MPARVPRQTRGMAAPTSFWRAGSIRKLGRDPGRMADQTLSRVISGIRAEPFGRNGDIYRWLRTHHAELAADLAACRPSWRVVADRMGAEGLLGKTKRPPTARAIRLTWRRVCGDLAAEKETADIERLTGVRPASRRNKAAAGWLPSGFAQPAQLNAPSLTKDVHQGNHSAALSAGPQQRPAPPPTSGGTGSSIQHAPGSISAAREKANLRSGLKSNGEPKY